jgi:26S proteasome regulatory subunit T1
LNHSICQLFLPLTFDISLSQGLGPYAKPIKELEDDLKKITKNVNDLKGLCSKLIQYSCVPQSFQILSSPFNLCSGIKESDTGLAPQSQWDLVADQQMLQKEQPLQVARNTKIINADSDEPKYVINIKQMAKYVVALGEKVSPTDIEEGMRVGVDRNKYQIQVLNFFFHDIKICCSGFHSLRALVYAFRFRCHRRLTLQ